MAEYLYVVTPGMSATAGPIILNPPDNPFFVNVPANVNVILPWQQCPASLSLSSADGEQFPSPSPSNSNSSSPSVATPGPGRYPTTRTCGSPCAGPCSTFWNSHCVTHAGKKNDVCAKDVWTFYKEQSGCHECLFCL